MFSIFAKRFIKMGNWSNARLMSSGIGDDVRKVVDNLISSNKVVVFSKTYCPYCRKAKRVFNKYNLKGNEYYVWEIDKEPNTAEIQNYLQELTGGQTVPRVFINGKFIGGGDDTMKLHTTGKLAELLKK